MKRTTRLMTHLPKPSAVFQQLQLKDKKKGNEGQSTRSSVQPVEKSPSTPSSQRTSTSDDEFNFPYSQYRPQTILKRKFSEDLTNFAEDQARMNNLQGLDAEEVTRRFAHYTLEQKLIALYASQKRQKIDIERMYKAASGPWVPSATLVNKIRTICFLVLVNPGLHSYTGDKPAQLAMNLLRKYPRLGFTAEMAADTGKQASIEKLISDQLIIVRNEFKTIIHKYTSVESNHSQKDIYSLSHAILAAKVKLIPKMQLTVNIAARFAFLRGIFLIKYGHRYWNKVDKLLGSMRVKYGNDEISACFKATLDEDRVMYPPSKDDTNAPELPYISFVVDDYIDESESIVASF